VPSPFPGMNPFFEQEDIWQDFHQSFIPLAREMLNTQVQPSYFVKIDEYLFIHELSSEERRHLGRGDLTLGRGPVAPAISAPVAVLSAPANASIPLAVDIEHHAFLEIRDRRNRDVVTIIELLNPSNKNPGPDREQYLGKRRQILLSNSHFVEIDLLRGGPRLPVDGLAPCDYYALVSRVESRPQVGVWPIQLREPLPAIPVPLRKPDESVSLDLQQLIHRVYDGAGYASHIYAGSPKPPLTPNDQEWAESILTQKTVTTA